MTWVLMVFGNIRMMFSSGRLVITTLNLFRWSTRAQRLSVRKSPSKSSVPDESCLRPPHSSNASITITGSCSGGISSSSVDNGVSMSNLKRRSISDDLSCLLPSTKCWHRDGYLRTRSDATTRQRASVVILVDCMRSKRNDITGRSWSSSRVKILAAKADFPTPGDPLIQITLWPSALFTLLSISCRMVCRVSFIHALCRRSLSPPRVRTKSSSSFCSAPAFAVSIEMVSYESCIGTTGSPPCRFTTPTWIDFTSVTMAADTTNQTSWTVRIRRKDQTLLDSHVYCKLYHKFVLEVIKLVLLFNYFLLLCSNKNVLD